VKNTSKMENTTIPKLTCKQKIIKWLEFEERDWAWLARKTDIPYGTLYGIFVQNTVELTKERLNLINVACKTNFKLDPPVPTD